MNQGCQGATVEITGTPSDSAVVATGLVVSGVEATSIMSTSSSMMSSLATSAARFGLDWLSLTMTSKFVGGRGLPEVRQDEIVGFGEGRQRTGLRAYIAKLDRAPCAMAGAARPPAARVSPVAADVFKSVRRVIMASSQ
jgi:hypothetical protein